MPAFDSLPKHYDPQQAEAVYPHWEKNGYFSSEPVPGREHYSILLPPPNVTGTLHMGHAFQHTLMDALIRRERMCGKNTLWQAGTDHAGIATQIVVTRELERKGIDVKALSREEFLRHAWTWKAYSGNTISRQMRRLGASCDWTRECFTLDPAMSDAVTEAFVRLYAEGLIYRGERLVNWDPVLQTAVSDLEVVREEEDGMMFYVRYPFVDEPDNAVTIATTRPETILIDGAVAVNPQDDRFTALVGRKVWVPLTDPPRIIEIIADNHVDPSFGSGCVKVSPAHDFNDYAVYCRHPDKDIPLISLFTPTVTMNENAPRSYQGLDRYVARKRIIADLAATGLLVKQLPHRYQLPRSERSGVVVEPMLSDQWFVRMEKMAEKGLALADDGRINFIPANWRKTYDQWLAQLHDWCISRQLIWGHRIPAWYDPDGNIYVARDEAAAQQQAGNKPLRRDDDVLDTWFSSALWPFSTLGWPATDNPHFAGYFPTTTLVTGFDIIFFWVARMAMMTDHFIGETPFRDVYITGLVRDAEGQKMSKSRGNILDPLDLVDGIDCEALVAKRTTGLMNPNQAKKIAEQTRQQFPDGIPAYGVDALRFTFASLASYGRNIKFDLLRCAGYRNFCNKLWNAARFVLGVYNDETIAITVSAAATKAPPVAVNDWIESRLQRAITAIDEAFDSYRFDLAARALYQFIRDEYCDWYLEAAKVELRSGDDARTAAAAKTLAETLEAGLRLCHPLLPFISEQLWQKIAPLSNRRSTESVMLARWPTAQPEKINSAAEADIEALQAAVEAARKLHRATTDNAQTLTLQISGVRADAMMPFIAKLAGIRRTDVMPLDWQPTTEEPQTTAGGLRLAVTASTTDNTALAEQRRHALEKIRTSLQAVDKLLANPNFLAKAKATVIEQKKQQKADLQNAETELLRRL